MSTSITLPSTLRDKIAALARRIRLLRAARGLSLLVLVLSLLLGAMFLWDSCLGLSQAALAVGLGLLIVATGFLLVVGLLLPQMRRLNTDALAALVEERYPDLGERLTSTVELTRVERALTVPPS